MCGGISGCSGNHFWTEDPSTAALPGGLSDPRAVPLSAGRRYGLAHSFKSSRRPSSSATTTPLVRLGVRWAAHLKCVFSSWEVASVPRDLEGRLDELLDADPEIDGPELAAKLLDTVDGYEDLRALMAPVLEGLASERIARRASRVSDAARRRREEFLAALTVGGSEAEGSPWNRERPAVVILGGNMAGRRAADGMH